MLVAVLTASYAHAQFAVGARAGFMFTRDANTYDGAALEVEKIFTPGFQLGAVGELSLTEQIAVQPGLLFVQTRAGGKGFDFNDNKEEKYKMNINQLFIPINVMYKLDLGVPTLILQAGPYFGFGIGGSWKYTHGSDEQKGKVKFGKEPDNYTGDDDYIGAKALDMGLGFGLGLQAHNMQFSFTYNIGLANVDAYETDKYKLKYNAFMFNLTYFFGFQ